MTILTTASMDAHRRARQSEAQRSGSALVVWAVHDGVKVRRDDLRNANKAGNAIWDGRRVQLVAARNEIVAFQVIVEAGDAAIAQLSARLPELRRDGGAVNSDSRASSNGRGVSSGGRDTRASSADGVVSGAGSIVYVAPATDPTLYRDRPIQIFSEHYMSVTQGSRATWVFRAGTPSEPKDALGWIPVQLVPENAAERRGGLPLRVEAHQNQALWFDIYVGRDLAPGRYRGDVTITAAVGPSLRGRGADGRAGSVTERRGTDRHDALERRVPVELDVLDVTLPDENSLRAMVYYQAEQPERYQGRNLDPAYHRFAKRHRVEFVHAYDPERALAAMGRFRGSDFTRAEGYEGPGEGVGNQIVPRTFYGPGAAFADRTPAQVWRTAEAWMQFLDVHLPHVFTFLYMPDEPRPDKFPEIRTLGETLRSNPGPGRRLPTFVTHEYTPELARAIDIWCAVPWHYDVSRAAAERAAGKQYWFYNGGRPASGALIIDSPATDARVVGWAAFKHGADGYFYWHASHWHHNSQKKIGDRNQNVWANPITFDNRSENKSDQGFINGDGVLVYPGQEVLHPDQDRGIAGPISTIQMANLRRGLQDHLLLTMARRLGLNESVDRAVTLVVPRVLGDAEPTGPVGFSENGNDYEEARQLVLRAIAAREATAKRTRPVMPPITKPVMFDTPEADAILSALQVFPPDHASNQDISTLSVHANSARIIASIGADKPLEYNLDMNFIIVPGDQPRVPVRILDYPAESDPGPFPVPDNAPIENWPLHKNENTAALPRPNQTLEQLQREGTGDRHVLIVDPVNGKLHEFWQARKTDAGWQASNAATFDLRTGALRPERWTSADAAGLPIFPAVVRYDECERGMVEHAMRVTVRRTRRAYVLPATHWASPHRDPDLPRMGERLRLRKDFDESGFPPHARAILRGLKKYGMFVADNGSDWWMSIAPDRRLKGLETLSRVKGADFEVVDTGARSVAGQ